MPTMRSARLPPPAASPTSPISIGRSAAPSARRRPISARCRARMAAPCQSDERHQKKLQWLRRSPSSPLLSHASLFQLRLLVRPDSCLGDEGYLSVHRRTLDALRRFLSIGNVFNDEATAARRK